MTSRGQLGRRCTSYWGHSLKSVFGTLDWWLWTIVKDPKAIVAKVVACFGVLDSFFMEVGVWRPVLWATQGVRNVARSLNPTHREVIVLVKWWVVVSLGQRILRHHKLNHCLDFAFRFAFLMLMEFFSNFRQFLYLIFLFHQSYDTLATFLKRSALLFTFANVLGPTIGQGIF